MAPATLAVSNEDPPSSRYGSNTIELVLLTRGESDRDVAGDLTNLRAPLILPARPAV